MKLTDQQRAELKALAAKMLDCVPHLQKHNADWFQHAAACCGLGVEGIRALLADLEEAEAETSGWKVEAQNRHELALNLQAELSATRQQLADAQATISCGEPIGYLRKETICKIKLNAEAGYHAIEERIYVNTQANRHNTGLVPLYTTAKSAIEQAVAESAADLACFRALIKFLLRRDVDDLDQFLRLWNEGSFEQCRIWWPEAPEEVYPKKEES